MPGGRLFEAPPRCSKHPRQDVLPLRPELAAEPAEAVGSLAPAVAEATGTDGEPVGAPQSLPRNPRQIGCEKLRAGVSAHQNHGPPGGKTAGPQDGQTGGGRADEQQGGGRG